MEHHTGLERTAPVARPTPVKLPGWLRTVLWFARRKPLGASGALIILIMSLVGIFANQIAPYDPLETNYQLLLQPPNRDFWLGTDAFGRDILSRIIFGSRTALLVGFSTSFFGATLGAIIGVVSAYYGGKTDLFTQRIMDILLSFFPHHASLVIVLQAKSRRKSLFAPWWARSRLHVMVTCTRPRRTVKSDYWLPALWRH